MSRVVVCGAGPAGASLAYLLARRGIDVALVERQRDFAREFRGEAVMPSGRDAFRQMGLEADFERLAQARPTRVRLYRKGRFRVEFSAEDQGLEDLLPRVVSQPEMLEMLVDRCSAFPCFRLLRGGLVTELLWEGGRVAGVQVRGETDETLRADLVIGADGRGSAVRRKSGLAEDHDVERFDVVWFKVPRPRFLEHPDHTALVFLGIGHLMLGFPSYDGRLQMAWIIEKGTFGDLRRCGVEHWVDEMARHAGPEFGEHLRASKGDLAHPFVLDVVCYLMPEWTAPGVLLLGDAAHPMSPVGGQGINIALRDAIVAANHLVPVLESRASRAQPEAIDAAARAFQAERYAEASTIQRLQRVPPRVVFGRSWWARALLAAVPTLARVQVLGARGGPVIGRFAFGVTDVKLAV
jgi:2-polyprenyl-6-methoxyphenol hydroxylase-like FAD-dependent oxidoreductase